MASINFNPFGDNWFKSPPKFPIPSINLVSSLFKPQGRTPNFAAISNPFPKKAQPEADEKPGKYTQMLEQFYWECENLPDYRHRPEVEKILQEDPIIEKKENPTQEEIEENERWWAEFKSSPVVQFLTRAEEIADKINELELQENSVPYKKEDKKYWQAVPNVIGLDGRPMPRKAIKTRQESDDKFWDFARQFFFGLWGFRQRPYPPGRPIDVAQAIGYKALERRYYDFIMKTGGWYYKDRLGRSRGPMELIQLKTAWGAGIIDKDTFIWGDDLDEWAPISMVYGLERAIATWEVRLGAAATAAIHKLQKGIPPWVPLKGHEKKTYKQLQDEAYESKRRDLAVLEANNGVWPGVRIPSHALFLWASGSELTTLLEEDHMPNKYIPKDLRRELAKIIPGLRPWEVLSIEQAMENIVFGGKWHRVPLGSYTTGPPYIAEWNKDVMRLFEIFHNLSVQTYQKLEKTIPGFDQIMEKVQADAAQKAERRKAKRAAEKKEKEERRKLESR
ncbi:protein TIC 56, chloroplastic [Salvia hispanica]|uniref:protein TIC 56, chloroplastic n=1 Tax=Salvia hispanica TaxID=49212 RepID=UPI002009053C|nr:protein TIC 56, chloroplastic [Salvia hispanica]